MLESAIEKKLRITYGVCSRCASMSMSSPSRTIKDIENYKKDIKAIEQKIAELKEQNADEYDIKYQVRILAGVDCRNK